MNCRKSIVLGLVAYAVLASSAVAAENGGDKKAHPSFSSLFNVEFIIDRYVEALGRKYDLTDEQYDYTHKFVSEKANELFSGRKDEILGLVDEMVAVRGGGEMTQEQLIAWGKRAQPIFETAKTMIVDANDEWRSILTTDQKQIHDADLVLMHKSFAISESQLTRIVNGSMTVDEFRNPASYGPVHKPDTQQDKQDGQKQVENPVRPPVDRNQKQPNRNRTQPTIQQQVEPPPPIDAEKGYEGPWEKYVKEFIAKYKLNKDQKQKCNDILKAANDRARGKWPRVQANLKKVEEAIKNAKKEKDAKKKKSLLEMLEKKKDKASAPINLIFETQLKKRLETIPSPAQRKAVDDAKEPKSKADPKKRTRTRVKKK